MKSAWEKARESPHVLVLAAGSISVMISLAATVVLLAQAIIHEGSGGWNLVKWAIVSGVFALLLQGFMSVLGRREVHAREDLFETATMAKAQTDELFAMTDMLQSADDNEDAAAVLMATTQRLLPGFGASLYVFNNSRDRLDLAGSWNMPEGFSPSQTLSPTNCWALKRGKPHINDPSENSLCCRHHGGAATSLEVPMMARGSVYGLLILATQEAAAKQDLTQNSRLGQALADSMSLALANISLREKLRTQSLRDPLTGLYNRRYMEDALERYVSLAERTGGSTSVLMLDLDNFKLLNDEHGHAKGDAVLRDVAAQLVGALRPADVVCRYGGEELLAILPNCSLEDGLLKAELLRARIEGLSEAHQLPVSASIGLASIPETSTSSELVTMADAALYEAKRSGKNRVACAPRRANRSEIQPRLVVSAPGRRGSRI